MADHVKSIDIDRELCRCDGRCIAVCPRRVLRSGADGFPEQVDRFDRDCIECGHCLAVCPHGALTLNGVSPEECRVLERHGALGLEIADALVRGRRSVREFREEPVPAETLDWLLDSARWAPSAANRQPVHFTLVDDRATMHELAGLVVEWMRGAARPFYQDVIVAWDAGIDRVLHDAPHLLVAHAADDGFNPTVDCTIALTTVELAAHALGVGACWAGFFMGAALAHQPLIDALDLPPGHRARAALMLGLPRFRYRRVPARREARVRRLSINAISRGAPR